MRDRTACFSGHRFIDEEKKSFIAKIIYNEVKILINKGFRFFGNGGAIGFDVLASKTILRLKEEYPSIKLIMVLPCPEQDKMWRSEQKREYRYILSKADKIVYTSDFYHDGCMLKRNEHLVNNSSCCIAYLKHRKGGTFQTVKLAEKQGLQIINIADLLDI